MSMVRVALLAASGMQKHLLLYSVNAMFTETDHLNRSHHEHGSHHRNGSPTLEYTEVEYNSDLCT